MHDQNHGGQTNNQGSSSRDDYVDPRHDKNSVWYGMPLPPKLDLPDFETTGKYLAKEKQLALLQREADFKFEHDWLMSRGQDGVVAAGMLKTKYDKENQHSYSDTYDAWRKQQREDDGQILKAANTKKGAADVKVGDNKDTESKPEASVMREEEGVGKGSKSSSSSAEGDPLIKRKKAAADMLGFK